MTESTDTHQLTVILPDGSEKVFDQPVTPADVAAAIGPGLAKAAVCAEVDGRPVGLDYRTAGRGPSRPETVHQEKPGSTGRHATFLRPRHGPRGDAAV